MAKTVGRSHRRRAVAAVALLSPALLGTAWIGAAPPAAPGQTQLHNLEHVFNFNPGDHDPQGGASVGTDLEFFTQRVPLREYATGAFVDEHGAVVDQPVMAERDFAVMGSYQRGGYVFDITDPEDTQFVTQVTCRQDRNDVAVKKFTDPATGATRVVLALTQQSGIPCDERDDGAGFRVNAPSELQGFHDGVQWAGTADIDGQTGELVYAGTGCTPASYAPVSSQVQGNIALVDESASATNPADQCPTYTFVQKVRAAQEAGAIGFVQIAEAAPNRDAAAGPADIPAIEVNRTEAAVTVRDAVIGGTAVNVTLDEAASDVPVLGEGSGGIGVFDITDPYAWSPMYRLITGAGGVHNFIFHPTEPYGYAANGALPGLINDIPIVDFTDLDAPQVLTGRVPTEGGVHDVELTPGGDRAYAASENNYRIYDTTDPANPVLLSRTPNVGSYAHGVFPTSDGSLMVTNNESLVLGGFLVGGTAVCPGEGLASYDTTNEALPVGPLGYYVPNVAGPVGPTDARPCTSHFGRFAPGTRVLSMGWYIAGTRVVDWSDPANPVELAAAVLEGTDTWAAKFYKGPYVYAGDRGRGFDVFRWTGEGRAPWVQEADVAVSVTDAPDPVAAGNPVTYTVDVANAGPDPAPGVTVRDTLPRGVTLRDAAASQGSCSASAGTVTCALGTLVSGATARITLEVGAPGSPGPITNTATVSTYVIDHHGGNNRASARTGVTGPPQPSG